MARKVDQGEDSQLNMTPMIDICFQLIVFFMLTLRFKSIDKRFESNLPKDRGQASSPAAIQPFTEITVKLFRKNRDKAESEQFTRIRVGETLTVELPKGPWPKEGEAEAERLKAEDKVMKQIENAIADAWAAQGKHPEVKGEIKTPFPDGQLVPHGDVMRVLDAFLATGMTQVNFEGAAAPQMKKDGGGWDFDN